MPTIKARKGGDCRLSFLCRPFMPQALGLRAQGALSEGLSAALGQHQPCADLNR